MRWSSSLKWKFPLFPLSSDERFHKKGWTFVGGLLWKMPSPFDSLYKERPLCSSFPLNQGGNHPLPFSFDAKIYIGHFITKNSSSERSCSSLCWIMSLWPSYLFQVLGQIGLSLSLYHSFTLLRYILLLIKICCLRAMWVPLILVNKLLSKNKRNLWWVNML